MARIRQQLNKLLGSVESIEKMAADPEKGHHQVIVRYEGDKETMEALGRYVSEFEQNPRCCGCGIPWAALESKGFMPGCPSPGVSKEIVVTYSHESPLPARLQRAADEPAIFDSVQDDPPDLPIAAIECLLPDLVVSTTPDPDPEILIPSDEELANMTEDQLDQLIERIREKQTTKK